MTIAIVHYHLGPGGVSKIIAAASRAFTAAGIRHVILAGPAPAPITGDLPLVTVPGLEYRDTGNPAEAAGLLDRMLAAARARLGSEPVIWHVHNHSLGKNTLLPQVVDLLAASGRRLLLHIHDLAEDGRPENQHRIAACPRLYPLAPRIHYAFLNRRDHSHFTTAGLPAGRAHLLPNPVAATRPAAPSPSRHPLLFYPVRGIRRKNLGEILLLTALAPAGTRTAVSRAPANPAWLEHHDTWRAFAGRTRIPVDFDVAGNTPPPGSSDPSFSTWLDHASHLVTTSVSEGFGMVFLEAAALGKPLLGRNLPHVTAGPATRGIDTRNLYDHLLIPAAWIPPATLDRHLTRSLEATLASWNLTLEPAALETARHSLDHDGMLDFGNLPESLQRHAIRRATEPENRLLPLVEANGIKQPAACWLATTLATRDAPARPQQLAAYSPEAYRVQLTKVYQDLFKAPCQSIDAIPPDRIRDAYLTPRHFHFLTAAAVPPPPTPNPDHFKAVVFDVYGTLLAAPAGGVRPEPAADPALRGILRTHGFNPPDSPSSTLHEAVRRHHRSSPETWPEIDLQILWREILGLPPDHKTAPLVQALEAAWHPASWIDGACAAVRALADRDIPIGLLSNAQCNTLNDLEPDASRFATDLTVLSYQYGIAKPSPELFQRLSSALAARGISPPQTLFIGNDPLHDIEPAAAHGFQTALFTGHPDSFRPGPCLPDFEIPSWPAFCAQNQNICTN